MVAWYAFLETPLKPFRVQTFDLGANGALDCEEKYADWVA